MRAPKHSFFLLMLLAYGTLSAQIPGYQGKRWPISIDVNLSPALADWVFQPEGQLELNWRAGIEADHVISRRLSAGANVGLFSTRQNFLRGSQTGFLDLDGQYYGLQLKHYRFLRRGNIAPLGPYQRWEVQYLRYRLSDPRNEFPNPLDEDRITQDLAVSFTLGTQRMLGEHFTYHIGIQTAFVLNLTGEFARRNGPQQAYLNQIAIRRLRGMYALNLNAGIGVLLF
ncbi:MAG: hypothetical protein AAFQ87_04365 [Bacteroidota bacterium]